MLTNSAVPIHEMKADVPPPADVIHDHDAEGEENAPAQPPATTADVVESQTHPAAIETVASFEKMVVQTSPDTSAANGEVQNGIAHYGAATHSEVMLCCAIDWWPSD